jgi:Mg2+ and Co2+ transporter CorA
MKDVKQYRDAVMTHLMYIKEKVDSHDARLSDINGKVSKNENAITRITTIGATFGLLATFIMSYLGIKK